MKPRITWFREPYRLAAIHTVLIVFFMFAYWRDWFPPDPQVECTYGPYFWTTGPLVYGFLVHYLQHQLESVLPVEWSIYVLWGVIPGILCIVFGGLKWWLIELLGLKLVRKLRRAKSGSNNQLEVIVANAPKPQL